MLIMVKSMKKFKNPTCLECGEYLKLNKTGHFTNKDGTASVPVFVCEDCDQAYAVVDGVLSFAPYDSSMNLIIEECKTCGRIEHHRQKMVWILNDLMIYNSYCPDCAVEFLRNWQRSQKGKVESVSKDNVFEIAEVHSFLLTNEVMNDPVKYARVKESEPYRRMAKDLGVSHD
jgi:hypothetical protein